MRYLLAVAGLLVLGACTWWIGKRLSTDAISMIVGLVAGILALLPTTVMVLAAGRRQGSRDAIDLAQGRRPELPMQTWHTVEHDSNGVRVEKTISVARPFGHLVDEQRR